MQSSGLSDDAAQKISKGGIASEMTEAPIRMNGHEADSHTCKDPCVNRKQEE